MRLPTKVLALSLVLTSSTALFSPTFPLSSVPPAIAQTQDRAVRLSGFAPETSASRQKFVTTLEDKIWEDMRSRRFKTRARPESIFCTSAGVNKWLSQY